MGSCDNDNDNDDDDNYALYNIMNSFNNKNSNHCVKNDFTNTFLAAQMQSLTLAGSPEF